MAANSAAIRWVVAEVTDDGYARAFGGSTVERAEIIDLDSSNPRATTWPTWPTPRPCPPRPSTASC
jgi:hypothetical protein